jgi:transposase
MLQVEVNWITGDPLRLNDAISYLASGARAAVERQPGSLGMSLLSDPEVGAVRFESFWVSGRALVESEDVTAVARRAAAHRAGGAATAERYEVLVFEREAPLRGGAAVRVTRLDAAPSTPSKVEDAVAWYGDTAVPWLADIDGFCGALLYADWTSGRLMSETVWRDPHALAMSRSTAAQIEAAAAEAQAGVLGDAAEYRLVFSSARPA